MPGPLITAAELLEAPRDAATVVLDATVVLPPPGGGGPRSGLPRFAERHPPGAVHADLLGGLADLERPFTYAHPGAARLLAHLAGLGLGDGVDAVVYDDGGMMWASRLWWGLRAAGFERARVLDGGLDAWRSAGGALERGTSQLVLVPDAAVTVPRPERFADRERVRRVVAGEEETQLVCTLIPEVFAGHAPTRYARPGHIPGSSNLPAAGLLEGDGRLLAQDRLAERLGTIIDDPRPVLLYCGGGISASLVALGLTVAGREDVAVYDGSLEEWAADPSLPLEVSA